jgi:hypothetical protein
VVPVGAALAVFGIWLFFGWFGFHTLFFDRTIEEAVPTFATTTTTMPATTTASPTDAAVTTTPTTSPTTTTTVAPGPITLAAGEFVGRSHPTSGTAVVIGDGGSQRVLRLEDFRTDNGPDLFVYLSASPADAPAGDFDDDFVDLGALKGNVGEQNYGIPADVDLERYATVVIWCRRFTVVFGAAALVG